MLSDLDHPRKLNLTFLVQILFSIQVMITFSILLAQVMAKCPGFAPGVVVVVSSWQCIIIAGLLWPCFYFLFHLTLRFQTKPLFYRNSGDLCLEETSHPILCLLFLLLCLVSETLLIQSKWNQGCHWEVGARDFPWLLSKENRRKIEPKYTPSCLIPCLLVVFSTQ